jgi:hypothetical protein
VSEQLPLAAVETGEELELVDATLVEAGAAAGSPLPPPPFQPSPLEAARNLFAQAERLAARDQRSSTCRQRSPTRNGRRTQLPSASSAACPACRIALSVMATHDVSLNITKPIPVGNVDIEIPVRRNGRAFGKVKISKGAIDWMPANKSKTAYYLDWAEFARVMAEYGHPV